jgi:hypothetical protein
MQYYADTHTRVVVERREQDDVHENTYCQSR